MDKILWRKLTKNDMNAINGLAAPAGGGGGAKHIALGVASSKFPIHEFLGVTTDADTTIDIQPVQGLVKFVKFTLISNPGRRNGEWIISDQHQNRYPLWTPKYGFPAGVVGTNSPDRPVIFIFRIAGEYHARFCTVAQLGALLPTKSSAILSSNKNAGIMDYDPKWSAILRANLPILDEYGPMKEAPEETIELPGTGIGPAPTVTVTVTRRVRETKICKDVKEANGHTCAFCGVVLARPHSVPYSEGCHIWPLNELGPDVKENIIVLCPNHHVEFDYGAVSIDPVTMKIQHIDSSNAIHNKVVTTNHAIDKKYIDYHYKKWKSGSLMAI